MGIFEKMGNGTKNTQRMTERLLGILVNNESDILVESLTLVSTLFGDCDVTVLDTKRNVVGSTMLNTDYIEMAVASVSARPFVDSFKEISTKDLREGVGRVFIIPLSFRGRITYYLMAEQYGKNNSGFSNESYSKNKGVFDILSIIIRMHTYEHNSANSLYKDSFTNLGNRDALIGYIHSMAEKYGELEQDYSIIVVRILNTFELINTPGYGEQIVNELLRKVAHDINIFNNREAVYRISNNEFALVCNEDLYGAKMMAENLIDVLTEDDAPFMFCAAVTYLSTEPYRCLYSCESKMSDRINSVTLIRFQESAEDDLYTTDSIETAENASFHDIEYEKNKTTSKGSDSLAADGVVEKGSEEFQKAIDIDKLKEEKAKAFMGGCGGTANIYDEP